jgi:hypothetical protein
LEIEMEAVFRYVGPKKKRTHSITDKEKLWLARMLVGEGGKGCSRKKARWLLWAIMNRWMLWPGRRFYRTFIALMRAFSQPINPRWMTGGDLARKYIGRSAASAGRLRRRARICRMTWHDMPNEIRTAVNDFADGNLRRPELPLGRDRISNWASLPKTPIKNPQGFDVNCDWFFEDKNLIQGVVKVCK